MLEHICIRDGLGWWVAGHKRGLENALCEQQDRSRPKRRYAVPVLQWKSCPADDSADGDERERGALLRARNLLAGADGDSDCVGGHSGADTVGVRRVVHCFVCCDILWRRCLPHVSIVDDTDAVAVDGRHLFASQLRLFVLNGGSGESRRCANLLLCARRRSNYSCKRRRSEPEDNGRLQELADAVADSVGDSLCDALTVSDPFHVTDSVIDEISFADNANACFNAVRHADSVPNANADVHADAPHLARSVRIVSRVGHVANGLVGVQSDGHHWTDVILQCAVLEHVGVCAGLGGRHAGRERWLPDALHRQ